MNGVLPIALSGLSAASTRLTASAQNVANADTSGSTAAGGGTPPYQPWLVVQTSAASGGVAANLQRSTAPYLQTYAPDNPQADAEGMIGVPDVDYATEVVDQVSAMASFKANLAVIRTADEMQKALLDTLA
jgi:flagellar basal-body rod protein FlgC